ncbi:MAG: HEAT repeat domain-containing protein [Luteolibacter sp.]
MNPKRFRLIIPAAIVLPLVGVGAYFQFRPQSVPATSTPVAVVSTPEVLPLNPVVEKIISDGPTMPYLRFNYLIKELPVNLASHDIDALIAFISADRPQSFSEGAWGSIVNDIQENLTVQTVPSEDVAQALIAIFRDGEKIQMQRDYALQHIGGFAIYLIHTNAVSEAQDSSGTVSETRNPVPHIFNPLLAELKSAAAESSKPWSGTALNLLDGLLRAAEYRGLEIAGLSKDGLVEMALPLASDPSAPLNARLPALQAAARRDSPRARDLAREILGDPDSGVMLIQSASAALARLGTEEDLALLRTASASANRHTATAIKKAIHTIQAKSNPASSETH